ncbi:rhodanese-like domain-containing protein [Geomobilimonas luticola]|uniref:Rhodanese-like domain-containing protein n=1 Tax=Geomobilimonas luticola TaxID=1114878 RepID=A0ABS5S9Z9_9BACT|nr:rhodanese-like domain-containing protein [Geomobilimonas luticola]MBT0652193.1 rhodanese-like domain-containing protein [Geomobilimonas luticola]
MKTVLAVTAIVTVLAASAVAAGYKNIASGEAKGLLAKKKSVYLLDVRTPDEYRQARLAGSVLIPVNEIERRLGEIPKNRPVLVYCAVGSRSGMVAGYLAGKGYGEVYNMQDGIVGWYRNGYPISR